MKKCIIILLTAIFITGCGQPSAKKQILAKVNNYEITLSEFNEEFKDSKYAARDISEAKADFLNNLINRKLILQAAQENNLDKDKTFLKMIERFWEQSLVKLALEKKSKEIAGSVSVSDKAIKDAYEKKAQEGRADKPYEKMYSQIKWEILSLQETQIMNNWLDDLHKKAQIEINNELLQNNKEGAK